MRDLEQLAAELEHIIRVARLTVTVGALGVKNVVLAEMLPLTVAAGDVGVMCHDHIPEGFCIFQMLGSINTLAVDGFAVEYLIALDGADELRNCRICVSAVQNICTAPQHLFLQGVLIEVVAGDCVIIVAGDLIELIEAVVHAAVFD